MSKARAGSKPKPTKKAAAKATKVATKTTPKAAAKRPGDEPALAPNVHPMPEIRSARTEPPPAADEPLVAKWSERGAALLGELAAHGAEDHEYRVDLKDGRFVWLDPRGRVSAEARARALCSYAPTTSSLTMAWADPLLRAASVRPIDRMPTERDDVDEEGAWHVAIAAAEASGAEWLYRVAAPHSWYFLALSELSFQPISPSFTPGSPAGLVLLELEASRKAIRSGAEPAVVVRERLARVGSALLHEAEYAYRSTDWVSRLARTGKRLEKLAGEVPVPSFESVAKGASSSEWLAPDLAGSLDEALGLLVDEWRLFA
ncbi:DUF6882 domain-containing protein [Polyangium sp. y55x31]|uniref:DUF6882 domain-containing protein n=1 Tax=Polyangium sp. y55x31 TaxID=3042688 RepID=UPI002482BE61|nr:DUF6882 domain-containing protein [Polyangium sp. y55x31]MDI1481863.1 hypothetical protein [Polyangium sp. y55x31]